MALVLQARLLAPAAASASGMAAVAAEATVALVPAPAAIAVPASSAVATTSAMFARTSKEAQEALLEWQSSQSDPLHPTTHAYLHTRLPPISSTMHAYSSNNQQQKQQQK